MDLIWQVEAVGERVKFGFQEPLTVSTLKLANNSFTTMR